MTRESGQEPTETELARDRERGEEIYERAKERERKLRAQATRRKKTRTPSEERDAVEAVLREHGWVVSADDEDVPPLDDVVSEMLSIAGREHEGRLIAEESCQELRRLSSAPIPMVLHCPNCGRQHVDAPDPESGWKNPPHRTHLCHGCGSLWRPANVATEGVQSLNGYPRAKGGIR